MLNIPVPCGFIPEDVLYDLNASQALVYGTIHYLSLNKIAVTTPAIQKYLKGIGKSTIIVALKFLRENFFVKKQEKEYLFKTRHSRHSKNFVDAKELAATHIGACLPMHIAVDPDLKRIDKMLIAFMYGLNKIDINLKFNMPFFNTYETFRCRERVRVALERLLDSNALFRYKFTPKAKACSFVYYYVLNSDFINFIEQYEGETNA